MRVQGRAPPRGRPQPGRGPTRAERYREGKALRRKVSRSSQGSWTPSPDRPDPIELLIESARGRLPELLPIRYGRMATSAFSFLRGAAAIMAHDLAEGSVSGPTVQLAGDAHVGNFGLFGTPERDLVFDIDDFDETIVGPWEWDVKRLATSLVLLAKQEGLPRRVGREATHAAARSYRRRMHAFAGMRYLETWYSHLDLGGIREVERAGRRWYERAFDRARAETGFHTFPRFVEVERGRLRIRDLPPLIVHYSRSRDEADAREIFERYRATVPPERRLLLDRYHLEDVAQKVVGVGSVGTRCSVGLFVADRDLLDPVFLQVKQALPSVYEAHLGPSPFPNHAERVVDGQRRVQESSDIFLGWSSAGSDDYYVRELHDTKIVSDLVARGPKSLLRLAELCGASLARAHARTGDPARIAGYLGRGEGFDEAICGFSEAYARQSEDDHAALLQAIRAGRLPAEPGV